MVCRNEAGQLNSLCEVELLLGATVAAVCSRVVGLVTGVGERDAVAEELVLAVPLAFAFAISSLVGFSPVTWSGAGSTGGGSSVSICCELSSE